MKIPLPIYLFKKSALILLFINSICLAGYSLSGKDTTAFKNAKHFIEHGMYQEAIPLLHKHIKINSKDENSYFYLAKSYHKTKNYDKALMYYKKTIEINPKHNQAHNSIGKLYLELGNKERALHHLMILKKHCYFVCSDYKDLKKAIDEYSDSY